MLDNAFDKLSLGRASLQQVLAVVTQNRKSVGWISAAPSTNMAPDTLLLKVDDASLSTLQDNPAFKQALQTAKDWLDQAVDGLREAGDEEFIARGLLARASFHRYVLAFGIQPDPTSSDAASLTLVQQDALLDLAEAHDIALCGGMRLFLTDFHLGSSRLALTVKQSVHELSASDHVAKARQLIEETGYKRRLPELEYLEQQLLCE